MDFGRTQFSGLLKSVAHEKTRYVALLHKLETLLELNKNSKLIRTHFGKLLITSLPSVIYKHVNYKHPILKILMEYLEKIPDAPINSAYFVQVVLVLIKRIIYLIERNVNSKEISNVLYDIVSENIINFQLPDISNTHDKKSTSSNTCQTEESITIDESTRNFIHMNIKNTHVANLLLECIEEVGSFEYERIRVCKITGGSLEDSYKVEGIMIPRAPSGKVKSLHETSVGVFNCPFDVSHPELKSTVLFKNHEELLNFSKDETEFIRRSVDALNFNVAIVSGNVDPKYLEFADARNILVLNVFNTHDLKRISQTIGARVYHRLGPVTNKGHAVEVSCFEENGMKYTKITGKQNVRTIVLRHTLEEVLQEYERIIEQTLNNLQRAKKPLIYSPTDFYQILQAKIGHLDCIRDAVANAIDSFPKQVLLHEDRIQVLKVALLFIAKLLEVDDYLFAKKDILDVKPRRPEGHWDEDH